MEDNKIIFCILSGKSYFCIIKNKWFMEKQTAWDYALGLIKIDGLTPTPEFLAMVEKEIQGEMTLSEIELSLNKKYKMKGDTVVSQLKQ